MQTVLAHDGDGEIGHIIDTHVVGEGSATHPHIAALVTGGTYHSTRSLHDLADTVHYLVMLHGRYPGVIDHAASRSTENAARQWILTAAAAFASERSFLTQLSVVLGPVPSTSGQNVCDTTVLQQRHALDMLAQSDRRGCALGAAAALTLDWLAIRRLLDNAALRAGIEPAASMLPSREETIAVINAVAVDEGTSRAIQFGTRQLLGQHRGLWDLLKSRTEIRLAD